MRRFGERWWIPGSAAVVAAAAVFTWLAPVVLAPLFNKFERLEAGQPREDALELADRAGVDVGEVYRVDASRRSTAINAYVGGIGSTKRVVLYDTLLEELDRGERRSVIAHELGHVKDHDIRRGLLFIAISTPLALVFATVLAREIGRAVAVSSFAVGVAGNQLSRDVEARADTFALELTDDPQGFIELQQELADRNLADPDPPQALQFLFGTHPTTAERIGEALAFQRGDRP